MERQAVASMQVFATYEASGRYEMRGEMPTIDGAIAQLDEALDAPFAIAQDGRDRELLELMGVR